MLHLLWVLFSVWLFGLSVGTPAFILFFPHGEEMFHQVLLLMVVSGIVYLLMVIYVLLMNVLKAVVKWVEGLGESWQIFLRFAFAMSAHFVTMDLHRNEDYFSYSAFVVCFFICQVKLYADQDLNGVVEELTLCYLKIAVEAVVDKLFGAVRFIVCALVLGFGLAAKFTPSNQEEFWTVVALVQEWLRKKIEVLLAPNGAEANGAEASGVTGSTETNGAEANGATGSTEANGTGSIGVEVQNGQQH